jgi:hypothetical protein
MKIAGIDYSLRCPCICTFVKKEDNFEFSNCNFYFVTETIKYQNTFSNIHGNAYNVWAEDFQRYETLADWAIQYVGDCDQIGIEGYSYGSSGKVFHIAENTGILKYKLYQMSIPLTIYPPTEIKKFATGKGNADKEKMYDAFLQETLVDIKKIINYEKAKIDSPLSDIVDSYFICKKLFLSIS